MPFTRTDVAPSTNSKVTVHLAGLLLLRPGASQNCEIGVHRFARTHDFQVTLVVKKPDRPPRLIRLIAGPLTAPLEMNVVPTPAARFRVFAMGGDPFDRSQVVPPGNVLELDYRWSFNPRALYQHDGVNFNYGANPIATLNAGVLYTSTRTRPGLRIVQICGRTETDLHRIAADLAIAVDLPVGSTFVMGWSDLGDPETLTLPRPGDPDGTTYTISLLNDPPISVETPHDELRLYYRVLERAGMGIPEENQCRIELREPQKSDEIPCMPVYLEP